MSKYLDLMFMLDFLYRYYPKYYSTEIILLAEDALKWFDKELPEDSSSLAYLQNYFDSPYDALNAVWKEIALLAGPFSRNN